jgi:class 3 adenylate cyclase
MARFARDCVMAFNAVVKHLEAELGPDTGDLGIRVGVHSGPVTAGVIRGERSRFQLFGGKTTASVVAARFAPCSRFSPNY